MEYIGLTDWIAISLFLSVLSSSIISIYFGAVNVVGEISPILILIIWFSGNNVNEINQTSEPNTIM